GRLRFWTSFTTRQGSVHRKKTGRCRLGAQHAARPEDHTRAASKLHNGAGETNLSGHALIHWEDGAMALFGGDGGRREKEKKARAEGRLPPGQSLTLKWPVLHYGSVPGFDPAKWDFKISGLAEQPLRLSWQEFRALP